jgi:hypothetical protein
MKSIAAELGLTPEAAEEAVLAEVRKIKNRADTAERSVQTITSERDTIKNRATALEADLTTLRTELADADLAPLAGKLKAEELAPLKQGLITTRAATLPLIRLTVANLPAATEPARPLTNRADNKAPTGEKKQSSAERWSKPEPAK